jgi:uncharacterized protein involved in type VI secretion and phage assembly
MTDHAANLDDVTTRYVAHSQEKLFGKYLGIVAERNDPNQLGRLRLKVPSVFGDATTEWAWPASPFAGAGYGFLFVPRENDLVWVEFAEGDRDYPLWTGCAWARPGGKTEVPKDALGSYPDQHVLRTPSGSVLVFDDTSGKEKIVVRGKPGCEITIDPSAGTVTIKAGTVLIQSDGQTQELATKFFVEQVFDTHVHGTAVGPSSTPQPQSLPGSLTTVLKAQ